LDRLRLGYWLMLREGSFRRDLEGTLKPLAGRGVSLQRLILVTDGMDPDDTAEHGHIDHVVRRAVSLGLPPMQAIQAVTLNPATYAGLEQEIGGIAPGRHADLVLLEDLAAARVHATLIGGEVVAEEGRSLVTAAPISLPEETIRCLRLKAGVKPDDFRIPSPAPQPRIRAMELLNLNITAERVLPVKAKGGALPADLDQDLLKVAVFDRHGQTGKIALGFLKGFGAKVGAVGTTSNLDENTLLVAGSNDEDMAHCANLLIESGGGIAVVDRGEVLEKMEFPVGGIFSLEPWRRMGERLNRMQRCLRERGAPFSKPIYALSFLTFVALPSLRITSRGLINAKERKIVPLMVEE
ncbi:MAG: adenine deaminase C-terminal domain-containing protein, partial [Candidatus Binatia bacterium]